MFAMRCAHSVNEARPQGRCTLEVAYVEGGSTPSAYWMRVCEGGLEFQPLGRRSDVRRLRSQRFTDLQWMLQSPPVQVAMRSLAQRYPAHEVPSDQAFFGVRYSGAEVHVTSEQLPPILCDVFRELDDLFREVYPSYRGYLVRP